MADELAYDALPEATRLMVERVLAMRFADHRHPSYESAYEDGLERGKELAKEEAEADAREVNDRLKLANESLTKDLQALQRVVATKDDHLVAARLTIDELREDLRVARARRASA